VAREKEVVIVVGKESWSRRNSRADVGSGRDTFGAIGRVIGSIRVAIHEWN
jgi:hypothetical protein